MKDCELTCADCGGGIEHHDVEWHDGSVKHMYLYWCDRCEEFKDNEDVVRKELKNVHRL